MYISNKLPGNIDVTGPGAIYWEPPNAWGDPWLELSFCGDSFDVVHNPTLPLVTLLAATAQSAWVTHGRLVLQCLILTIIAIILWSTTIYGQVHDPDLLTLLSFLSNLSLEARFKDYLFCLGLSSLSPWLWPVPSVLLYSPELKNLHIPEGQE